MYFTESNVRAHNHVTPSQLPLTPSVLLQSSPLSFIESLEGSLSSSSSSSSLAVQADEEEDGEEANLLRTCLKRQFSQCMYGFYFNTRQGRLSVLARQFSIQ